MTNKRKNSIPDDSSVVKRTRRLRGKRGILEGMPEMPLDVLFIVDPLLMLCATSESSSTDIRFSHANGYAQSCTNI